MSPFFGRWVLFYFPLSDFIIRKSVHLIGQSWARYFDVFTLGPGNFQLIGNFGHAFDMTEGFLGHLFLEVGVHHAAQGYSALLGLKS